MSESSTTEEWRAKDKKPATSSGNIQSVKQRQRQRTLEAKLGGYAMPLITYRWAWGGLKVGSGDGSSSGSRPGAKTGTVLEKNGTNGRDAGSLR